MRLQSVYFLFLGILVGASLVLGEWNRTLAREADEHTCPFYDCGE